MFLTFLQRSIRFSAIFLFGSTGETLTEKSGNLNLGTPGIMCMGATGAILGAQMYMTAVGSISNIEAVGAVLTTMIMALIMSALGGLIYSFITVTFRCNQNVTGLALTTFGLGLLSFVGGRAKTTGFTYISQYFRQSFDIVDPNWFEKLFLSYGALVYIAIIVAIITAVVIRKTRTGLNLRAVGESPATADAAGISVTKYKYVSTVAGSMISGMGGLFFIMDYLSGSIEYTVDAYGWMAVALVIFTVWRTDWAILGSIIFSMLYIAPNYISGTTFVEKEAIKLVPYLVTIVVLIITSIIGRKETQPPSSLGVTYFREER